MGILDDIKEAVVGKADAETEAAVEEIVEEKPKAKKAEKVIEASGAKVSGIKTSGPK